MRLRIARFVSNVGFGLMLAVAAGGFAFLLWGIGRGIWCYGPGSLLPGHPGHDLGIDKAPWCLVGVAIFFVGCIFTMVSFLLWPKPVRVQA